MAATNRRYGPKKKDRRMGITIRDIANLAGTSIATVSRVLNNSRKVAPSTRRRVLDIIEAHNYTAPRLQNDDERDLSLTVGLLMPDINNLYYPAVVGGLDSVLSEQGYNIFLCNTGEKIEREISQIRTLRQRNVDGIIFLGTRKFGTPNEHITALAKEMPVLMINDQILGSNVYSIMADETEGAYRAVSYLIELGHRRIAFVKANTDYSTNYYKQEGYLRALRDNGLEVEENLVFPVEAHELGGYDAGRSILSARPDVSAVFTSNDQQAMGLMRAVCEVGKRIPDDLSVVGFSDIPIAQQLFPPLTTVNQFAYKTGTIAADTIIKLIRGRDLVQKKILIEPHLSIRQSCRKII